MLDTIATSEEIALAKEHLEKHNLGQRGVFDGEYWQQFFGLLAQMVVCREAGVPVELGEGFDGGFDLALNEKKIDVKCVIREGPPRLSYACNLTDKQMRYDVDAYIFCSYNRSTGVFSIAGWIHKQNFKAVAKYNKVGDRIIRNDGTILEVKETGFYECQIADLVAIRNKADLRKVGA